VRCFIVCSQQQQDSVLDLYMEKIQVAENKIRVKALANSWRSSNDHQTSTSSGSGIGNAVRSEIEGESLRGMEHITCSPIGQKRFRVKKGAIRVVLDCEPNMAMKMKDGNILANVYGAKAREALIYAKRIAMEDAAVAAEILAEDVKDPSSSSSSVPCCNSSSVELPSIERNVKTKELDSGSRKGTNEIINPVVLDILSRKRSLVALQA